MPVSARPPRPLLSFMRPFTTHVFNRFSRLFVHRLPGFAIIRYPGRKTGKIYRTPMNYFRAGDAYVFALTYGSDVQWVKNVLAAGEAELQVGSKAIHLTDPELLVDPSRSLMPPIVRLGLGLMRVTEFLRMRPDARRSAAATRRHST